MPFSLLTTGDEKVGRSLQAWGDALIYAIGQDFRFGEGNADEPLFVLNIVCLPIELGGIPNAISYKRSAAEYWSTFNADYVQFTDGNPLAKLTTLVAALIGAMEQIPDRRVSAATKRTFAAAAAAAATRLVNEPDHQPR